MARSAKFARVAKKAIKSGKSNKAGVPKTDEKRDRTNCLKNPTMASVANFN